ncbi:MAG: glycosyltransferase family 4 protein [Clostridia bacterium]
MKVLIVNPILYTSEKSPVKKVQSIKDTMIYNLCLAFKKQNHEVTLVAADDFKPTNEENYEFNVIFLKTRFKHIFKPHCFPFLKRLGKVLRDKEFDLIISSEVFSINSLYLSLKYKKKTIIWHELAKHNNMMKKIPSKLWYNIIARFLFKNTRIVARSRKAYDFISTYCNNVSTTFIDHGVDLNKFDYNEQKKDYFIVLSQLIKRKRVDGIIKAFKAFINDFKHYKLIIVGDGIELENLKRIVKKNGIDKEVIFKGFLSHEESIPLLASAKAMLINTEKDNNMVSVVESIAVGTPIVLTKIPYNSDYIEKNKLGVVTDYITSEDLKKIVNNNQLYIKNCKKYRLKISNEYHVKQFIQEYEKIEKY